MALAAGKSRVRSGPLTLHTETAIDIAQKLTGVCIALVRLFLTAECFQNAHSIHYEK